MICWPRIIFILTKLYPIYRKLNHLEELELGFNYITELNPSGMSNLKNLKHFSILGCRGSPLKIHSNTFRFFQCPNFLVYISLSVEGHGRVCLYFLLQNNQKVYKSAIRSISWWSLIMMTGAISVFEFKANNFEFKVRN